MSRSRPTRPWLALAGAVACLAATAPALRADVRLGRRAPVARVAAAHGRARSRHGADGRTERPGALPHAIAAVENLVDRVIAVLRAQRPAAQAIAARVPDTDLAPPQAPERDLLARFHAGHQNQAGDTEA